MTKPASPTTEELKRYLYQELTEDERETLEEKLFENDEVFYEATNLENDLVDMYARKALSDEERARFEKSLPLIPQRRQKVSNAVALQRFIAEEKQTVVQVEREVVIAVPTFWQKLTAFFSFEGASLQYAMGAMLLLLGIGAVFLVLDNSRTKQELAQLQNNQNQQTADLERQERLLQGQLAENQQRQLDLQTQVESQTGQNELLTEQLAREQSERTRVERQLDELRKTRNNNQTSPTTPNDAIKPPVAPTLATVFLTPFGRGGNGAGKVNITRGATQRVVIGLSLPNDITANDKLSVELNGTKIADGLAPKISSSNDKASLRVTVPAKQIKRGENKLTVKDAQERKVGDYILNAAEL